jgi:phage major head subunit gpT-like protein
MIINEASLAAVFTGLKATFDNALAGVESPELARLTQVAPSTGDAENYPTGALLGDLEEVIDEVTMTNIGVFLQTVPNRTFARIVEVRRSSIEDDSIGVYKVPVQSLARRAALYPLRLTAEALLAGFTQQWVDGTSIFSTVHAWPVQPNPIPWVNRANTALAAPTFAAALQAFETMRGPDGAPLGNSPDVLVCGPVNRAAAEAILLAQYGAAGASNLDYKRVDLMVIPRFGTSRAWFLACTRPIQPLVLQDRIPAEFTANDDSRSHRSFYAELYAYKARRRCAVAILAPWLIYGNTGA